MRRAQRAAERPIHRAADPIRAWTTIQRRADRARRALGDSWQKGAQQLTVDERTNLANDPLELLAVDGPTNQAKGDADAASWLPPNKGYRCAYVARQIAVKTKYRLWVTPAEKDAMAAVLSACPDEPLPVDDGAEVEVPAPLR